jgi:phage terminase large subunit
MDLPFRWAPRPYQRPLWDYLEGGGKRAIAICCRRWGKDEVALHHTACAAHLQVGNYWHLLPQANQARRAIWDAVNPHTGQRRIDDAFPKALRETTRENEMSIKFKNGSQWQVIGSDQYNALVGTSPRGIVFSEWALADPKAWTYIRPILLENDGWALFITTPRGRNHACTMYEAARTDPEWFTMFSSATDIGIFSAAELERERTEMIREMGSDDGDAAFRQEYLCDFDAGLIGSYYGHAISDAERDGRIGSVPWLPNLPVHTGWDLGRRDTTTVWFFQLVGHELHFIDYLENNGVPISWYAKELDRKPYKYGTLCLPHDAESEHLAADKSIAGQIRVLG